ncbi:hypothetical protein K435DRAFT_818161 [Dendrothele bispora CBS 962.96]|uniref:C2HC/C3H-type domain-containing protein n=1 Tax=Dendrothele bispora (strain CBS 962.96) TaxID=1314807 RepID=A0A4S8MEC5_DENBC|nr:hypothetical protein K435DRAFT_818161 [Dendrothele bispora CBS 962.96]
MPPKPSSSTGDLGSEKVSCPICGRKFASKGIGRHQKSCKQNVQDALDTVGYQNTQIFEFHPRTEKVPELAHFSDFGFEEDTQDQIPQNFSPWRPFRSRLDFEVAEFALNAGLSDNLTDDLINLLKRCHDHSDKFTIETPSEMRKLWDHASAKTLEFKKESVSVDYQGKPRYFDVHFRPLWDWVEEIVTSKDLASKLVWDARHLSRFDGEKWERFIDEPWTADTWWRIQGELPANSSPFFIILYADKNKLSSFGTQKGYPVIARCANLPSDIRNGTGLGGGRLVGWLPIVEEDTAESGKTGFVNFKNAVWHESVRKIIESLIPHSKTGCTLRCSDEEIRCLFPILHILSADYEEQCVMALIRGLGGLCPCPKCLVPQDKLSDLSNTFELRSPENTHKVFQKVNLCSTQAEKEDLLKQVSLRPHPNVFLDLNYMDPYRACSFDELHFDSSGLWGDHLFSQFKKHLDGMAGRTAAVLIDSRFSQMPSWSKLNHFSSVTGTSFNDGSKHRDISKIFLFAAHDVFQDEAVPFQLLRALRAYLNMTMYGDLTVQTESTIQKGRDAVLKFSQMIARYDHLNQRSGNLGLSKSWNFIKMHYHIHQFDDIIEKGASRVFGTKPNEKFHGPLRKIYHHRTNFKNVADQILRIQHQFMVAATIRAELDTLDEFFHQKEDESDVQVIHDQHIYIGSKCEPITIQDVEIKHQSDPSFNRFRLGLGEFLTKHLVSIGEALPNGKAIKLQPHDTIIPFRYLRVTYESMDTWRSESDRLRCNPSFFQKPRFDFILFQKTEQETHFGQLLYLLTCTIGTKPYSVALIQPYKVIRQRPANDKRLGLIRIQKDFVNRDNLQFIPVESIIRGTPAQTDRFIMDVVDGDMFLRMKELYPGYTDVQ